MRPKEEDRVFTFSSTYSTYFPVKFIQLSPISVSRVEIVKEMPASDSFTFFVKKKKKEICAILVKVGCTSATWKKFCLEPF